MENSEIVGCSCSLLMPVSGYGEGVVVEDYGTEVLVRLTNGKEVVDYRDDNMLNDRHNHIVQRRSLSAKVGRLLASQMRCAVLASPHGCTVETVVMTYCNCV